jgi:hypothetical protein
VARDGPYAHEVTCCPTWTLMAVTPTIDVMRSGLDVDYNPDHIVTAAEHIVSALVKMGSTSASLGLGLRYDAIDLLRQRVENLFTEWTLILVELTGEYRGQAGYRDTALRAKDVIRTIEAVIAAMQTLFGDVDDLLLLDVNFKLSSWLRPAARMGTTDGLPPSQVVFNAKNLITAWGDSKGQGYPNYAAKSWNGLYRRLYKPRWDAYFAELLSTVREGRYAMSGEDSGEKIAQMDWQFCVNHTAADLDTTDETDDADASIPAVTLRGKLLGMATKWLGPPGMAALIESADYSAKIRVSSDVTFIKCRSPVTTVKRAVERKVRWSKAITTTVIMCSMLDAHVCGGVDTKGQLYRPLPTGTLTGATCQAGAYHASDPFVLVRLGAEPDVAGD